MSDHVQISNFKSIRSANFTLGRLMFLVGPNGSGKTSVLQGLHYLFTPQTAPEEIFCGQQHPLFLYNRGGSGDLILATENFRIQITPPEPFPDDVLHPDPKQIWKFERELRKTGEDWKPFPWPAAMAPLSTLLRLNSSAMVRPHYSERLRPRVESDGTGLASTLAYLALNQPQVFLELQMHLRTILPAVERVRFDRVQVPFGKQEMVWGDSIVLDMLGSPSLPAQQASEGTLMVLCLLTLLMGPERPKLLLLDDIDQGLHPRAQLELIRLVRELLQKDPDLNVVATTHSPYLLDSLEPEEILLATLRPDGCSAFAPLTEHPDFDRWKDEMAPGELWSLLGEQWVGTCRSGS